jgi:hypothetical protein
MLLAPSCKKSSKEETTKVDPCNQIIEVLDFSPYRTPNYQTTAALTYDGEGKVKTVKGNAQNATEYVYYSDRIEIKAKDFFGDDISDTYYLDKNKRIIGAASYNYDFKYNAEGYLISFKKPYGVTSIIGYNQFYLKYENDNLTEVYTEDVNVSPKKASISYYPEANQDLLGYNSPLYISNVIYDRNTFFLIKAGFFGKQSKDLFKGIDWHDGFSYGSTNYTKDSKGRITKINEGYMFKYHCP